MRKFIFSRSAIISVIAASLSTLVVSAPAEAGSRYGSPPPAVLSQDLIAPWVLQLRNPPVPTIGNGYVNRYRVQIAKPVYRPPVRRSYHQKRQRNVRQTSTPAYQAPKPTPVSVSRQQTAKPTHQLDPRFEPQMVSYSSGKSPGTIIIDTNEKYLYLVMANGQARRYGVGVGKPGFEWAGTHKISRKAQWPDWRPPAQMIAREKKKGRDLPRLVKGGPQNPLGARALYLGSSLYRIHGTNSPWTIGKAVSSGCIRMRNEDVMDLYERVGVGTRVIVS